MDAQAYLIRHGWTGPGNPLNANRRPGAHGGLGLTRPLLISRRENKVGIGQKSNKDPTNQWWLRGFEEALRGVGQDGTATPPTTKENGLEEANSLTRNGSQLYKFFVRGEVIPGTLDKVKEALASSKSAVEVRDESSKEMRKKEKKEKNSKSEKSEKKRKRDQRDNEANIDDGDEQKRKEEKRKKRKVKELEETGKEVEKKKSKKSKKSKSESNEGETTDINSLSLPAEDSNTDLLDLQISEKKRKKKDKTREKSRDDKKDKKEKKKRKAKDLSAEDGYPTPRSSVQEEPIVTTKVSKEKKPEKPEEAKREKKSKRKKDKKDDKEPSK